MDKAFIDTITAYPARKEGEYWVRVGGRKDIKYTYIRDMPRITPKQWDQAVKAGEIELLGNWRHSYSEPPLKTVRRFRLIDPAAA